MKKFIWTREKVEKLKTLHRSKKTHAQIGEELGCSSRAIQSKLTRLRPDYKRPGVRRPERTELPALSSSSPVRMIELHAGQCRWPLGLSLDKAEFYCGAKSQDKKAYCPHHYHRSLKVNEHGKVQSGE